MFLMKHEPLQMIYSVNGGPYAIRPMVGWTMNGPPKKGDSRNCKQPELAVNGVSVVNLDEL